LTPVRVYPGNDVAGLTAAACLPAAIEAGQPMVPVIVVADDARGKT
jgi:hypothetical protein